MVFVIDPIRYCVPSVGVDARQSRQELAVLQHAGHHRRQPTGRLQVLQPGLPGRATHAGAHSANASGGGHAQTRLRSPYAWSIRATGGQYLSGSTPVGNTASSRE